MAKPVIYLRVVERVGNVYETLQTTTHNMFPIIGQCRPLVSNFTPHASGIVGDDGQFLGAVTRSTLYGMLQVYTLR